VRDIQGILGSLMGHFRRRDSSVSIVTRRWAKRPELASPYGHHVEIGSGTRPVWHPVSVWRYLLVAQQPKLEADTHIHLFPRVEMREAIPPLLHVA
jgi:hypothetical protein